VNALRTVWAAALLSVACGPPPQDPLPPACEALCAELVDVCGLASFPDRDSCLGGCAYEAQEGADVDAYEACASDAACDPFALVACEEAHGLY